MIEEAIELPQGWTLASLGDVAHLRKEPVNPKEKPGNRFNYLSIGNVESKTGNLVDFKPTLGKDIDSLKLTFTKDDVLYSKLRPYLNKVLMPEFDGISATDLIPITPNKGIEKKYLGYYLRTRRVVEYANQRLRGIQLPRLTTKDLLVLTVPVAPLAEQRRIVAKVEALFSESKTVLEALDKVPALLRRFRQCVLDKAFMGELTQRDSNDEPAQKLLERIRKERNRGKQASPKENKELPGNLPNLPETWVRATIGEIAEIKMGQSPAGSSYNQDKRGVPLINGPTEFGEEHPTPVQWTTEPTKVCNKGDILICVRGNTTGRMNWADQSYCIGRGLAAISANPNLIEIGLLYHYLSKETEELMRRTTGSTFPNLQSNQLRNLSFPLAPYQEQKRLAVKIDECFSLAEKIEDSTKESSNQVEKIDQAILVKAFKGELVPQDPNDEPASILLKRMKGDLAKPGLVAKREKAKTDYQSKLPAEKRQIKSLEEVLREIGPTTIEQTFAASGLGMSEFWDKLRIDIETGRIEKLRRGHLILLRLKN